MQIAVILPVYGRHEQTLRNAARLIATAGCDALWVAAGGPDERPTLVELQGGGWSHVKADHSLTYWQALDQTTRALEPRGVDLLCPVANDLLPGHQWLARGLAAYRARFGEGPGLMGFNDGIHGPGHSPHFLIHRQLLADLGGWPVWYRHNFGDTELCARAQALGLYGKAPWAVLYHDHHITGAGHDAGYAAGDTTARADQALYHQRQREDWPHAY